MRLAKETAEMNLLLLGHGKTGALVEEVARERGHGVQLLTGKDNQHASGLIPARLQGVDAVIDFTTPGAVLENMQACIRNRTPMVVGTTGWYERLGEIEQQVQRSGAALLYASNFSIGVNIFFAIAAAAAAGIAQGYVPKIVERHHTEKKDAPSGTAVSIQRIVADIANVQPEITSVREGDTIGSHVLLLDSPNDTMMLVHDAKNRRGFAEGAVRAAEWLNGKTGFYEFRKIFGKLP
jgi:4-hydroxy-tetrahydrodipicolinate reductase